MKRSVLCLFMLTLSVLSTASLTLAQNQPGTAGRWEGSIDVQYLKLGIVVVLSQKADGAWTGTISIPAQALKDSQLSNVSVKGPVVSFAMPGVPGDPVYQARLSADGMTMPGELTQSGRTFPFTLERRTESESAARQTYGATPEKGQSGQGIEGHWQGTLEAGNALRLVLKVRKVDGAHAAMLDSPDQGMTDLVVDSIVLQDKSLRVEMKRLGASYEGALSQDGSEISGKWEQQGISLPLILRRLARK